MGSSQSYLAGEAALTVFVVAGALGLGYTQINGTKRIEKEKEKETGKGKGKAKGKKSDKASVVAVPDDTTSIPPTVLQDVIPGQFETPPTLQPVQPSPAPKSKKSRKKKTKAASSAITTNVGTPPATLSSPPSTLATAEAYNSESSTPAVPISEVTMRTPRTTKQSTTSIDTDGSWTRVEPRHQNYLAAAHTVTTTSDAATTTASSSPVAERMEEEEEEEEDEEEGAHSSFLLNSNTRDEESRRRTLAEKLLPKPRKTGVDEYVLSLPPHSSSFLTYFVHSMLETPDHPTLSRVMRVQPRPDEKPADGFSWGDYEDVREAGAEADADDEGWGVVKSKSE
jgi:hypothetical protein